MYSWSLSWISWCLVGASEVRGCNLCFSLLDWAAVLDSGQQGAVLNEVSVSAVTFCPLRLMGTAAVLSGERIREKGGEGREREQESESGRRKDKDFFFFGGVEGQSLHCTSQQCIKRSTERLKRKLVDLRLQPSPRVLHLNCVWTSPTLHV